MTFINVSIINKANIISLQKLGGFALKSAFNSTILCLSLCRTMLEKAIFAAVKVSLIFNFILFSLSYKYIKLIYFSFLFFFFFFFFFKFFLGKTVSLMNLIEPLRVTELQDFEIQSPETIWKMTLLLANVVRQKLVD